MQLDPTDYQVALQRAEARLITDAQLSFEQVSTLGLKKAMTGRPASEAPLLALRKPYLAEFGPMYCRRRPKLSRRGRSWIKPPSAMPAWCRKRPIGQFVATGSKLGEIFADYAEVRLPMTKGIWQNWISRPWPRANRFNGHPECHCWWANSGRTAGAFGGCRPAQPRRVPGGPD